jgi:hypothetical protein
MSQLSIIRPAWFWTLIVIALVTSFYVLPSFWPTNQQSRTEPANSPIATTPADTVTR